MTGNTRSIRLGIYFTLAFVSYAIGLGKNRIEQIISEGKNRIGIKCYSSFAPVGCFSSYPAIARTLCADEMGHYAILSQAEMRILLASCHLS